MEDILLFCNILDNAKPPRKYRERLLTIDELTDKELRSRYRFGGQSIEIITDLIRNLITKKAKLNIMHVTVNILGLFFRTGKIFFGLTRFSCLSVRMTDIF